MDQEFTDAAVDIVEAGEADDQDVTPNTGDDSAEMAPDAPAEDGE